MLNPASKSSSRPQRVTGKDSGDIINSTSESSSRPEAAHFAAVVERPPYFAVAVAVASVSLIPHGNLQNDLKFKQKKMPTPTPKTSKNTPRQYPPRPPASAPEVVDPAWLLKAIGVMILAALLCGYATLCLLFYQGQWQLILHPTHSSTPLPTNLFKFGADETGLPQLTGIWTSAAEGSRYANLTILYLRGGDGSLDDSTAALATLHDLGINIFAFDYRGYGHSVDAHPNQLRMIQDAETALQYLTTSRAIPEKQIIPYGIGLGTSLATHLAATHPAIPALILDSPARDPLDIALNDPRTKLLPVHYLFHDRFPLAEPLATLKIPKLLLSPNATNPAFTSAANPKITVELPTPSTALYTQSIARFLDQYVPATGLHPLQPTTPAP